MKVWELLLIPVSLAVTVMSAKFELQIVDKPPAQIKALIGSSLTLGCSFITIFSSVRVDWCFTANGSANDTRVFSCTNISSEEKSWCNHTLKNVQLGNNGSYYCKVTVEKPTYKQKHSTKTEVVVAGGGIEDPRNDLVTATPVPRPPGFIDVIQNQTFLIVTGTAGLLLVLLIMALTCVVQRRRRSHRDRMYPVYGNTRPQPSATRKQETSKPKTQEAAVTPPKSTSCRTAPRPKDPCRDARRKSTPKT